MFVDVRCVFIQTQAEVLQLMYSTPLSSPLLSLASAEKTGAQGMERGNVGLLCVCSSVCVCYVCTRVCVCVCTGMGVCVGACVSKRYGQIQRGPPHQRPIPLCDLSQPYWQEGQSFIAGL